MASTSPMAFWEQQLLGKPPLLLLPTDKPRTSSASALFQVCTLQGDLEPLFRFAELGAYN